MTISLEYQRQIVQLPEGESLVGRGLECRIRFNDPAVSRVHLRFFVSERDATLEDLGSTNGTLVNDQPLQGKHVLAQGDRIRIGVCTLSVSCDDTHRESSEQQTMDVETASSTAPGLTAVPSAEFLLAGVSPRPLAAGRPTPPFPLRAASLQEWMANARDNTQRIQHCPRCRSPVSFSVTTCPRCNYQWPKGHPSSPTQPLKVTGADRRQDTRWRVELPVLYSSGELTLHGTVRDLSVSGMYIMTDLLDPVGTLCTLRLLPDGQAAMTLKGMVRHVVAKAAGAGGRPPGMGIKFTAMPESVASWLQSFIAQLQAAGPAADNVD